MIDLSKWQEGTCPGRLGRKLAIVQPCPMCERLGVRVSSTKSGEVWAHGVDLTRHNRKAYVDRCKVGKAALAGRS